MKRLAVVFVVLASLTAVGAASAKNSLYVADQILSRSVHSMPRMTITHSFIRGSTC
jgi:hypothetical protein